jgi:uncharacterized damage-inducible protein DinB
MKEHFASLARRLTGSGDHPGKLDTIVYEDLKALRAAREMEDDRIIKVVDGFDDKGSPSGKFSRIYSTIRRIIAAKPIRS